MHNKAGAPPFEYTTGVKKADVTMTHKAAFQDRYPIHSLNTKPSCSCIHSNLAAQPSAMHRFFIRIPRLVQRYFSSYVWHIPTKEKIVYLTFDDGPHPTITPFVLDELKKYNAKATFFCIGRNVSQHPEVYHRILNEGHAVGNHTQNHLNGWKVSTEMYVDNVSEARKHIASSLFRPPYGRIRKAQAKQLTEKYPGTKIIMWDVLSADFDRNLSPETCLKNVQKNISPGSIIVFHDSEKAFPNMKFALPKTLEFLSKKGYQMECLNWDKP